MDLPTGRRIAAPSPEGVLGDPYDDDRVKADLWRAATNQMIDAGLLAKNVDAVRTCTVCHPELLHSYRRNGPGAGRQHGFVCTHR